MAYKNIHDNFWRDPDVRALGNEERLFLLYAITNPQAHMSGIYYLPLPLIKHEIGWEEGVIKSCIDTLSKGYRYGIDRVSIGYGKGIDGVSGGENQKFFLIYDHTTHLIWVRNMLRYQVYMKKVSPKIVTAVRNHLIGLPFCVMIEEFSRYYSDLKLPFFDQSSIPYATHAPLSVTESASESASEKSAGRPEPSDPIRVRLKKLCDQLSGNGFSPLAFAYKAVKAQIPFEVVEVVLSRLVKYKDSVDNKWGYAIKILQEEYSHYNYAQELTRHQKLKDTPVNLEDLFSRIKVVD